MKAAKLIAILALAYVAIVVGFESYYGYFQPPGRNTIVITITTKDGTSVDRVLTLVKSNGQLYVSANHWPRAWYNRALENPRVQVSLDGEKGNYLAVPVAEKKMIESTARIGIPSYFDS